MRTLEQWKKEIGKDMQLIIYQLQQAADDEQGRALYLALARKEASRLVRDIERIGSEVFNISKEEIDRQGPL